MRSLSVASTDPWTAELKIEGGYTPPLGPVGAVFDAAVGTRVARASIRRLLRDLADELETAAMFAHSAD